MLVTIRLQPIMAMHMLTMVTIRLQLTIMLVTIIPLVGITAHIITYIPITFVVHTTIIRLVSMTGGIIPLVGITAHIITYIPIIM